MVYYELDGTFTPKVIIWSKDKKFAIDKITDISYTKPPADKDVGLCFSCLICGKERNLYFEENRWFVQTK